ncbi:centromere protein C [Sesbania bispinosa]|nr:centromere protein C [Sesbania bispinosa]
MAAVHRLPSLELGFLSGARTIACHGSRQRYESASCEDGDRDDEHGEAMDYGDRTKRDGLTMGEDDGKRGERNRR